VEIRFNEERAEHAVEFFETLLVHTKGAYARERFVLAPFQREEIIQPLFGTQMLDPDSEEWVRLYNLAWLEVARKNGKSELMAGIGLLLTGGDDEEGAEVYGVAKDTDQASLVFNVAKRMVELSPLLSAHFRIYPANRRIVYPKTSSFYRVVAADALGNLGQDPHGILFDEVIAQPNGELWDALKTGFGARRQPLMVAATTAGDDPSSFAKLEHDFSVRVAEDASLDPRRFVFIRGVGPDADWKDDSRWQEANPALGLFLRPQVLRDEMTSALNNPREERRFRQFRLNQWQDAPPVEAWITTDDWMASAGMVVEDSLVGKMAFGGLVSAAAQDLTAVNWTFRPPKGSETWQAIWRFFLPEEQLDRLDDRTQGRASTEWIPQGFVRLTEGNVIDIGAHIDALEADIGRFDVKELAYDPNQAIGIVQPLMERKVCTILPIYANSPGSAMGDWERLIRSKLYAHSANPVLRWMVGNLMVREASNGVVRVDRKGSLDRVDGIVAAELALRRALLYQERKPGRLVTM
jgi:phage terminase large subunit-like protein